MTNFKKARIVNCKKASIRKNPSCTSEKDDVVGVLEKGELLEVDTSIRVFDWTDNEYYKCSTTFGDGYILTEIVEIL
jgi:hypothetical protein